jgi:serine/threonine-protein kinase HipA
LFRWLVFNVVMANDDCHLKNLSFFVAADGIRLTPHYDLLATGAYYTRAFAHHRATWPDVPMAIALPNARLFGEVTADSVLKAAQELGVPGPAAQRILKEVVTRIPAALAHEVDAMDKRHAALDAPPPENRAAEARFLRVLESIVVRDMLGRLTQAP